jgi:hypothetical protein
MHCNGCHGDSGGLTTRSYKELMLGGNLGKVIIPKDPARSLILAFLEGRRGPQQKMPKEGSPLTAAQIDTIRRWIAEGAGDDKLPVKSVRLIRSAVPVHVDRITRVSCRINSPSYLSVTMKDPRNGRVLWSDVGSLKSPKEKMDIASPGDLVWWDLRAGYGWPKLVTVDLTIRYAAGELRGTEFTAQVLKK